MPKKQKFRRVIQFLQKRSIPDFVRNRYFLSVFVFFIWITSFDSNNLISQVQLRYQIWELNQKIEYYSGEIANIRIQRDDLLQNTASLEKYARENYKMKRDNEDLYIIVNR